MIVLRGKNSLSALDCKPENVSCHGVPYSFKQCLVYDICLWALFFFVGLHFTYLDKLKLNGFNLIPSKMRTWSAKNWAVFGAVCLFALWVVIGLGYFYAKAQVLVYYCGAAILIVASVGFTAWLLKSTHEVHIHHYNIGMAFVVLIGY